MVNILIFSKNRAAQLELLLRSIKEFFTDWLDFKFNILYTYGTNEYERSYEILKKIHPEFNYILETDFKAQIVSIIDPEMPYTLFFVDDNVFKEPFTFRSDLLKKFKARENISCISLRLYPGIIYCYPMRIPSPPPEFIEDWTWACSGTIGDWNYRMSLDGHIFRTSDIYESIRRLPYKNPNSFESLMSFNPIPKPYMTCFGLSPIFNIPVNKVQTFNNNYCGNMGADTLNDIFLNGQGISLVNIRHIKNISCHQEIELVFESRRHPA